MGPLKSKTVEDYLLTDKLQSSILLPKTLLLHFGLQLDLKDAEDVNYINTRGIYCTTVQQGIFNIANYQDIKWDEHGQSKLEPVKLYLSLTDVEGYFGFCESFTLKREDLVINLPELNRFECEHGINFNLIAQQLTGQVKSELNNFENSVEKTTYAIKRISQKVHSETSDLMDPRYKSTLLTVIAALLEIISGEFQNKNVMKHPSIRNQSDLIDKLDEMETRGLSERNLQKIFSEAKTAKILSRERRTKEGIM